MKKYIAIFAVALFAVACTGKQQPAQTEEVDSLNQATEIVVDSAVVATDSIAPVVE